MVSTGRNQRERLSCPPELGGRSDVEQRSQINEILWTPHIVAGKDLQGDQVPRPGDAHPQLRQEVDRLGIGHHLRFDPRRREQEIHDWRSWLTGECEPDGRESSHGFLLDEGFDAVTTGSKAVDEGFGLCIGGQCDGQIRIAREPRLGPNGDSQAADERERDVGSGELGGDRT